MTLVLGHRGCAGEAPENTLASFQLALEQGCDGIELDIHLSSDGQLIVCHDPTVNRTTDGKGWIYEMTLEQLKRLDAGAWFHESFRGERIPTLEEVFDLMPANQLINIEIKHSYGRRIEAKLAELLRANGRLENVVVSSFDHKSMVHFKQLLPELNIGLLYMENLVNHIKLAEMTGIPVHSLHPYYRNIDKEDVQSALDSGLCLYPYTINEEAQQKLFVQYGVTGIITDFPGRLRKLLEDNP
jgi:glycerophosphoryl diester phosphodiesterase